MLHGYWKSGRGNGGGALPGWGVNGWFPDWDTSVGQNLNYTEIPLTMNYMRAPTPFTQQDGTPLFLYYALRDFTIVREPAKYLATSEGIETVTGKGPVRERWYFWEYTLHRENPTFLSIFPIMWGDVLIKDPAGYESNETRANRALVYWLYNSGYTFLPERDDPSFSGGGRITMKSNGKYLGMGGGAGAAIHAVDSIQDLASYYSTAVYGNSYQLASGPAPYLTISKTTGGSAGFRPGPDVGDINFYELLSGFHVIGDENAIGVNMPFYPLPVQPGDGFMARYDESSKYYIVDENNDSYFRKLPVMYQCGQITASHFCGVVSGYMWME